MITLQELLLNGLVTVILEAQASKTPSDLDYLDAVEIRPTSEELADQIRFAVVSSNDPADPDGWLNEEIGSWPPSAGQFDQGWGRNFNEPRSQAEYISATITLTLQFSEMGRIRAEAFPAANLILARIKYAIRADSTKKPGQARLHGFKDDFGSTIIPYYRAIKKDRLVGSGSQDEPNFSGKVWLRFLAETSHR